MSDNPEDIISAAVKRDRRFQHLQQSIAVENDIENNTTVKALMAFWRADADDAMTELADTSPVDAKAIALLSVRVGVYVKAKRILEAILTRGRLAAQTLHMQEAQHPDE